MKEARIAHKRWRNAKDPVISSVELKRRLNLPTEPIESYRGSLKGIRVSELQEKKDRI